MLESLVLACLMCCFAAAQLRVLIVDDHEAFRRATRRLLTDEGYEVVGEADGVASGYAAAVTLRPDVVLLDVSLADGSGLDLAARLAGLAAERRPRVVLTSSRDAGELASAAAACGAVGFLPKATLTPEALAGLLCDCDGDGDGQRETGRRDA
jgi:DNA-binding NarL/FixJ family response regulator